MLDIEKNGKRETERILKTQQELKVQPTDNCFNEQDDNYRARKIPKPHCTCNNKISNTDSYRLLVWTTSTGFIIFGRLTPISPNQKINK